LRMLPISIYICQDVYQGFYYQHTHQWQCFNNTVAGLGFMHSEYFFIPLHVLM